MFKSKRVLIAVASLAALVAVPAVAALWPNLPQIGGAAYCASYSTGPTGQECTLTVPAGPTSLSGTETVPMDTNFTQGRAPQTVKAGLASFNALPVTFSTLTAATATNTLTATNTTGGFIIIGSAALSPTTINLPPAPIDGQEFKLSSTATIAGLTIAATSPQTISNNPTALTVSTTAAYGYRFRYHRTAATTGAWYRLQ